MLLDATLGVKYYWVKNRELLVLIGVKFAWANDQSVLFWKRIMYDCTRLEFVLLPQIGEETSMPIMPE
jgi:hypothetical protein